MTRRSVLSGLAAAIAAAVVDQERELWGPGRKLISIPKPPTSGWADSRALKIGDTISFRLPGKFELVGIDGDLVYLGGRTEYFTLHPGGWKRHPL